MKRFHATTRSSNKRNDCNVTGTLLHGESHVASETTSAAVTLQKLW